MKAVPGLILLAISLAGCTSPTQNGKGNDSTSQARIRQRIAEIFDAASMKDMPRLDSYHLYGPAFTKFSGQSGRQDAAAARKGEHDGLGSIHGLSMQADDLKIDVLGNVGIATFIMNYSFRVGTDTIQRKERTTLVFVNDNESWKIVHEHLSPFQEK